MVLIKKFKCNKLMENKMLMICLPCSQMLLRLYQKVYKKLIMMHNLNTMQKLKEKIKVSLTKKLITNQ